MRFTQVRTNKLAYLVLPSPPKHEYNWIRSNYDIADNTILITFHPQPKAVETLPLRDFSSQIYHGEHYEHRNVY